MFLFFEESAADFLKFLVMAVVIFILPIAAIGWVIYSLVRNKSSSTSITDWKDSNKK